MSSQKSVCRRYKKLDSWCYQGTVNVLSGHPRWMFRKNSMEFLLDCSPTYTITTVAVP